MNKKLLPLLMALLWLPMAVQAQTNALRQAADSTINVVAFFCKGDSMMYHFYDGEMKIQDRDTTVVSAFSRDVLLVVTDSTKDSYTFELTPMHLQTENDSSSASIKQQMNLAILRAVDGVKVQFKTDELGALKGITNWREVRASYQRGLTTALDSLYGPRNGLDSVMPRKKLEQVLGAAMTSEAEIRELVEEIPLLFDLHGMQFTVGEKTIVDTTSALYPQTTYSLATYENDKKEGFEGDYRLFARTTAKIPGSDLMGSASLVFSTLFKDGLADKMEEGMKTATDSLSKDTCIVESLEDYQFFSNGWPDTMRLQSSKSFGGRTQTEYQEASWVYRSWRGYRMKEEEYPQL